MPTGEPSPTGELTPSQPTADTPVGGEHTARRGDVLAAQPGAGVAAERHPAPTPSAEPARISTLSYSSLTELERCGYRYYLERVLGIGEDRAAERGREGEQGLEARARGTLVHRLMELLDFARPQPPSPAEVAERARELGLRVGSAEGEELARLVASSCDSGLAARVASAKGVRREHPFAFSLGAAEPLINGVLDLLALEADGIGLVVDYKSDRVEAEVDLEALVEREYGVQRLLYALAVLRDGAPAVEIVHWFLERGEWVTARFHAADRLVLEEQLSQRIARTRGEPFAVSAHPHRGLCLTCPGRVGLCSWGRPRRSASTPESHVYKARLTATLSGSASGARLPAPRGMHRPKGALP